VYLRNDTPYDMANYSFVEYELAPNLEQVAVSAQTAFAQTPPAYAFG